MAKLIQVDIRGVQDFRTSMKRVRKLPDMTSRAMYKWGKILERSMKQATHAAGIDDNTGLLRDRGIEWRQRPKGKVGHLFIRSYGIMLDSMRTHGVNITQSRQGLLNWGLQARSSAIRKGAAAVASGKRKSYAIVVQRKPFIERGWKRARPLLNPIIREGTRIRR